MRNLHIQSGVQKLTIPVLPFNVEGGKPYLIGCVGGVFASSYAEATAGVFAYAGFDAEFDVAFTADRGLLAPIYIREDNKLYDTQGAGGVLFGALTRNVVLAKDAANGNAAIAGNHAAFVEVGAGRPAAAPVAAGEPVPQDDDGDGIPDDIDTDDDNDGIPDDEEA